MWSRWGWTSVTCMAVVLLVGVAQLSRSRRSTLAEIFSKQPTDPILSPFFLAYDAGDGAVRELERVARPLQGALSHQSQKSLLNALNHKRAYGELVDYGAIPWLSTYGKAEPHQEHLSVAKPMLSGVQRLYGELQSSRDRSSAEKFVSDDELARSILPQKVSKSILRHEEGQLGKEVELSTAKAKKGSRMIKEGRQELDKYRIDMRNNERARIENVKYMRAAENFALQATKDMKLAQRLDSVSTKKISAAEKVLRDAHVAEVKAKVTNDQDALKNVEEEIDSEISDIHKAAAKHKLAQKDRADAGENLFVSNVIQNVRKQDFGNALPIHVLAAEGKSARQEIRDGSEEYQTAATQLRRSKRALSLAVQEDRKRHVVSETERNDKKALRALVTAEKLNREIHNLQSSALYAERKAAFGMNEAKKYEYRAAKLGAS
uniref:Uncharacterized protein n=1 Tax=Hanusia phi TaxID=3032 RepID=A0A7S0I153_9CRYP